MGREFPQGEDVAEIHPFIAMSFFFASVAATMAVVTSLCGALSRKKSAPSSDSQDDETKEDGDGNTQAPSTDGYNQGSPDNAPQNDENFLQQPLPPPPGKRNLTGTGAASYHFRSNSSASTASVASQLKKLPASMSMRALGNGIGIGMSSRQTSKRDQDDISHDHHRKKDKKLKHEDSIWKKTIILGEKCKVPDEDDEDTILYDEKGNRITTYHRKTTSMALSRQNSNADSDAISSVDQGHKDESIKDAFVGKH